MDLWDNFGCGFWWRVDIIYGWGGFVGGFVTFVRGDCFGVIWVSTWVRRFSAGCRGMLGFVA